MTVLSRFILLACLGARLASADVKEPVASLPAVVHPHPTHGEGPSKGELVYFRQPLGWCAQALAHLGGALVGLPGLGLVAWLAGHVPQAEFVPADGGTPTPLWGQFSIDFYPYFKQPRREVIFPDLRPEAGTLERIHLWLVGPLGHNYEYFSFPYERIEAEVRLDAGGLVRVALPNPRLSRTSPLVPIGATLSSPPASAESGS